MNPPGPMADETRLATPRVSATHVVVLFPYDCTPTTTCCACEALAGKSDGPPESPSHVPGMSASPPWANWRVPDVSGPVTVSVPAMRTELGAPVCVTPKPTCCTRDPSARPSFVDVGSAMVGVLAVAPENFSIQKSWSGGFEVAYIGSNCTEPGTTGYAGAFGAPASGRRYGSPLE